MKQVISILLAALLVMPAAAMWDALIRSQREYRDAQHAGYRQFGKELGEAYSGKIRRRPRPRPYKLQPAPVVASAIEASHTESVGTRRSVGTKSPYGIEMTRTPSRLDGGQVPPLITIERNDASPTEQPYDQNEHESTRQWLLEIEEKEQQAAEAEEEKEQAAEAEEEKEMLLMASQQNE